MVEIARSHQGQQLLQKQAAVVGALAQIRFTQ
jgi:hypothetical protein